MGEYADKAYKAIQGNHGTIADNYLSLKAYAVTARDDLTAYTAKGKGKNLSSLGDLLNSIASLSGVKPTPSEGLSPNTEIPAILSSDKIAGISVLGERPSLGVGLTPERLAMELRRSPREERFLP